MSTVVTPQERNTRHFEALDRLRRRGVSQNSPGFHSAYAREMTRIDAERAAPCADMHLEALRRTHARGFGQGDPQFANQYQISLDDVQRERAPAAQAAAAAKPIARSTTAAPRPAAVPTQPRQAAKPVAAKLEMYAAVNTLLKGLESGRLSAADRRIAPILAELGALYSCRADVAQHVALCERLAKNRNGSGAKTAASDAALCRVRILRNVQSLFLQERAA